MNDPRFDEILLQSIIERKDILSEGLKRVKESKMISVEAGQIKTLADLRVGWKARGPA